MTNDLSGEKRGFPNFSKYSASSEGQRPSEVTDLMRSVYRRITADVELLPDEEEAISFLNEINRLIFDAFIRISVKKGSATKGNSGSVASSSVGEISDQLVSATRATAEAAPVPPVLTAAVVSGEPATQPLTVEIPPVAPATPAPAETAAAGEPSIEPLTAAQPEARGIQIRSLSEALQTATGISQIEDFLTKNYVQQPDDETLRIRETLQGTLNQAYGILKTALATLDRARLDNAKKEIGRIVDAASLDRHLTGVIKGDFALICTHFVTIAESNNKQEVERALFNLARLIPTTLRLKWDFEPMKEHTSLYMIPSRKTQTILASIDALRRKLKSIGKKS